MAARSGVALALVGVCAAIALVRSRPPSPRGADAPASEFSAARAMETLRRVLVDGAPHPVGSEAHERVRERILAELRGLGLEPEVEESVGVSVDRLGDIGAGITFSSRPAALALARNVVTRIPGTEETKAVLLCAHYDSVPAGPGAGDDGSGFATLLEVARALRAGPPLRRPVVLLVDDAEECGLLGAQAYVERHKVRDEVEVVVNCDARGTDGPTYLFETSSGNADLLRLYASAVDRPFATSAAYEVYRHMPNSTDLTVFRGCRVPGLNFAFIGGLRRYHTTRDDLSHLSAASLQHEGDQVLAVARALSCEEYRARSPGDVVFTDVLGLFLLRWPMSASLLAAIAILAAMLGVTMLDLRRRSAAVLRGVLLALATVAASALVAEAIVRGIELLRRHPEPWGGHPLAFVIAIVAGATLASLLLARIPWFARAGFEGSWDGFWIVLAAAGVAVAARLAGASYLFLAPCALALISRLFRNQLAAVALPACALAALWIPLAAGLEAAVELRIPIALGAPIGVLLAASCLAWSGVGSSRLLRLTALVFLGSIAWASFVPASTAGDPSRLSLVHMEEAGSDGARLFALTGASLLPSELKKVVSFSPEPKRAFPEIRWLPEGFAAAIASVPADAARIEVLETERQPSARILNVRCSSPRGASSFVVHLSGLLENPEEKKIGDAGVVSATLAGDCVQRPVQYCSWTTKADGTKSIECDLVLFGVPSEGVVLKLRAPLDRPAKLLLLDVAYGLPPGDARFAAARPERCVPSSQGDQWVVARRADL